MRCDQLLVQCVVNSVQLLQAIEHAALVERPPGNFGLRAGSKGCGPGDAGREGDIE